MPTIDLQAILHPTDYTEDSQAALSYAAKLALSHQARLVILHVVDTLGPERVTYGEAVSQPQPEGYRRRLWGEFHSRVPLPSDLEDVELVLREGDPVEAIVNTAREQGCDLIVMASHEHSGFEHWLFRGTTEKLLQRARCPVLVVRPSGTPEQPVLEFDTNLHPHCLTQRLGRSPRCLRRG
jgi:nucleotide-binding universal stress UspA family protein